MTRATYRQVPNAIRVAAAASTALANGRTALTSLVALPLLEVALVVVVASSIGNHDTVRTAYLGTLLALGLTVLTGTAAQVTRDRLAGVLIETLLTRPLAPVYWVGKVVVPALTSSAVAVAAMIAIFALDPAHDATLLLHALLVAPAVLLVGAVSGIAVALLGTLFRDPFVVSNTVAALLPLTAGVVAPLSLYPAPLAAASRLVPFSASIELCRDLSGGWGMPEAALLGSDLGVALAWLALGLAASALAVRRMREGADIGLAW